MTSILTIVSKRCAKVAKPVIHIQLKRKRILSNRLHISMKIHNFALISLISITMAACSSSETISTDDPVVARVAGEDVLLSELTYQFYRSGARPEAGFTPVEEVEELRAFLPLYTDYLAKLAEARTAGYFNLPEILDELSTYEAQTAQPYWLENQIKDEMLDEYIERAQTEIHASHILITLPQNPVRADTVRAYNRLLEAREKALAGESFDSLSVVYSSTQQGRSVGGDLGYFSVGWAVKDFEDAVYSTPVGQVSMPFRSQFGYHIVKVHDTRPASPDRQLSHIFFPTRSEPEIQEALEFAGDVYNELALRQITWSQAVEQYSQDQQSIPNQGSIGWVNYGRYDPRFTDVVMNIENQGDFTEPFYSGYGVHIVRLDSVRTFGDEESYRQEMLEKLEALPRFRQTQEFTNAHVRRAGNAQVFTQGFDNFEMPVYDHMGRGFHSLQWDEGVLEQPVFRLNNQTYTAGDYLQWIYANIDTSSSTNYHFSARERYIDELTSKHIVDITKDAFPEFARLSQEYLNGLVIFKISEDSVWNYARYDSLSVREMYEANPDKYRFDERYFYYRIAANNDAVLDEAISLLEAGVSPDSLRNSLPGLLVRSDVINDLSQRPFLHLQGVEEGGITNRFEYRNRRTVLLLDRIEPARTMNFDEAYFRVVSEYQPIREEAWVSRLRDDYQVQLFPERIQ